MLVENNSFHATTAADQLTQINTIIACDRLSRPGRERIKTFAILSPLNEEPILLVDQKGRKKVKIVNEISKRRVRRCETSLASCFFVQLIQSRRVIMVYIV